MIISSCCVNPFHHNVHEALVSLAVILLHQLLHHPHPLLCAFLTSISLYFLYLFLLSLSLSCTFLYFSLIRPLFLLFIIRRKAANQLVQIGNTKLFQHIVKVEFDFLMIQSFLLFMLTFTLSLVLFGCLRWSCSLYLLLYLLQ